MKRDWLLYLVIFSLALNLGTIGTLIYLRYQDHARPAPVAPPPMHMRELWGALHLEDHQRQVMRQMLPEHRRRVMAARQNLARKRQELVNLIKAQDSQWEAMRAKIREISDLQGGLEEEMARFLLDFKKHLKPEQQAAFVDLMQDRFSRMPPPGMGKGMGKGRGPMGMGPMGPKGFMGPMGPKGPPPPLPPD
ncbi:MAG: periplasmic heavy metal sensor [Deltaproteobacteria bacterium]|nr:periplasmic heavy metal sensor [Deltaproteobacteria bacterium]